MPEARTRCQSVRHNAEPIRETEPRESCSTSEAILLLRIFILSSPFSGSLDYSDVNVLQKSSKLPFHFRCAWICQPGRETRCHPCTAPKPLDADTCAGWLGDEHRKHRHSSGALRHTRRV